MALVDLKMSKQDMAEEASPEAIQNPYPYGICLTLDTDELDKLGITKLPGVGDEYHIRAVGEVTSVSENDTGNGQERSVRVQIQMMEMRHEDEAEGETEDVASEEAENAEATAVGGKAKTLMTNAYRNLGRPKPGDGD